MFFSNPDNQINNFSWIQWADAYLAIFERSKPFLYPLWFMKELFILNAFSKILQFIIDKFPLLVFLVLLILYLFSINFFRIESQSVFFFSCGYYIVKNGLHIENLDFINFRWLTVVYLIISALLCYFELVHNNIMIIHKLVIMVGILWILRGSYYLLFVKNNRILAAAIGSTFFIYVFHEWNLMILRKVFAKLLPQTPIIQILEFFLIPLIIITISIIVALILQRSLPRFYSFITGSR